MPKKDFSQDIKYVDTYLQKISIFKALRYFIFLAMSKNNREKGQLQKWVREGGRGNRFWFGFGSYIVHFASQVPTDNGVIMKPTYSLAHLFTYI